MPAISGAHRAPYMHFTFNASPFTPQKMLYL